jgi:hypothetical protein
MHVDAYALIAQKDGDVGDSLQREGMFAFGHWLRYDRLQNKVQLVRMPASRPAPGAIMDQFEVKPGIYVRHPDPTRWSSNPDTTSRDQLIPVIAYCGAYEDYPRLWRLFKAVAARGMFAQNTVRIGEGQTEKKLPDTMLLNTSLFIRAGGWWTAPLYPVLLATDTIELVGTMISMLPFEWDDHHQRLRRRTLDDSDDNNAIIKHLMAATWKPTPISWLNRYLYSVSRPLTYGNTKLGETNPVMGALRWYHRAENHGNPEMAELYRPLVEEYFTFLSPKDLITRLLPWKSKPDTSPPILVASPSNSAHDLR